MNDMKNTFRIETEDRYGRFSEYEVQATSKAEAEAIANKPVNVVDGSIVLNVVQVTFNEPDSFRDVMPTSKEVYDYDGMWGVSGYYNDNDGNDIRDRD